MDVFHRMVLTDDGERSLFSVANGIAPWTLVPEKMRESETPGLSMILKLPSPIDNREAMHDFVRTAERLAGYLNGVLKTRTSARLLQKSAVLISVSPDEYPQCVPAVQRIPPQAFHPVGTIAVTVSMSVRSAPREALHFVGG